MKVEIIDNASGRVAKVICLDADEVTFARYWNRYFGRQTRWSYAFQKKG